MENPTTCRSCEFGYILKTEETVTQCVLIEKPNINNCLVVSDETPFRCNHCEDGYYILDNGCVKVDPPIENCKEYDSPFVCRRCDNYHILSEDKSFCK